MQLNLMIDYTKLGTNIEASQIDKLISEAIQYQFKSVCINPIWVKYAKEKLKKSNVLVCTVIGFPHGTHLPEVKAFEAKLAVADGADELDMVINVKALREKDYQTISSEIQGVVKNSQKRIVKVIIETCYLTNEEIVKVSNLVVEAGAHFVKTSTGFGTNGATLEHVRLMKQTVRDKAEVKASGGVRTYEAAMKMIAAGATRIGTSNGIDIIKNRRNENDTNTSYWSKREGFNC